LNGIKIIQNGGKRSNQETLKATINPTTQSLKMNPDEYKKLYALEDNFFWFKGMRKVLSNLVKKHTPSKDIKILDAGCGTGRNLIELNKYGSAVGLDLSDIALEFCKKRGLEVKKGNVEQLPFDSNSFDLVTSIDVIYHKWVNSDDRALREIYRVLTPGGKSIVQVAAYQFMYSNHDRAVFTERRYTKHEFKSKLQKAGFKIERITYYNTLLFPFALVKRLVEKESYTSEIRDMPSWLNSTLTNISLLEGSIVKHINMPFGLSIIAVVKKEEQKT